jgi:hypothetical protein
VLGLAVLLVGLNALAPEPAPVPTGPTSPELSQVDAAVAGVNGTRRDVLATAGALPAAATALDGADEACATGNRDLAAGARSAAGPAVGAVAEALAAMPQQLAAYRAALAELARAGAALEPAQQQALQAAAAAGEREADAQEAFVGAVREVWPAYDALGRAQATWLERAAAGWYRDRTEASAAYAVLRDPVADRLEQARGALAAADAARRPSIEQMRAALAEADSALAALRTGVPG